MSVFAFLGRLVTRHSLWVVAAWVAFAGIAGAAAMTGLGGTPLFSKLETGQPTIPGSDSAKVDNFIFSSSTGVATLLAVEGAELDDPDAVKSLHAKVSSYRARIATIHGVDEVQDPFQHPFGPLQPEVEMLVSEEQDAFLVRVVLSNKLGNETEDLAEARVERLLEDLGDEIVAADKAESATVTSASILMNAVNHQMEADLVRGELIALPISLLVMVIVFGGMLAAGMPIIGALASILAGLGSIWGLSFVMELDSVVINVVTLLGLGLSIDYGLLVVSRFKEELQRIIDTTSSENVLQFDGPSRRDPLVHEAVAATVASAGRTVVFSALTIAISVAGLIAMPSSLLKGLGTAGSVIVLVALLTAITLVPAVLTLTGRRFLKPPLLSRLPLVGPVVGRLGGVPPETGAFSRLATGVQKHPWIVMAGCITVLLIAAWPASNIHLRNSGVDVLPAGSAERQAFELVGERFPAFAQADVWIVPVERRLDETALTNVAEQLEAVDGIDSVDEPVELDGSPGRVMLGLRLEDGITPDSREAVSIVRDIRATEFDSPIYVGGQAAGQIDFGASLVKGLPIAAGMVIVATFILLFLMTGSVLVPIKALLTNALSIAATLGITTWVFQEGHGSGLLGFDSPGGLESYVVAIVVAFGFGLAMDYEVFLLSRIKEFYDKGMSNDEAVVRGLQGSGRIITSAALVIIVVFAGFASGELVAIKEAGFALAVAVALDATLVRMLLVPATMTVLGDLNWWAPKWMKPIADRFAIKH